MYKPIAFAILSILIISCDLRDKTEYLSDSEIEQLSDEIPIEITISAISWKSSCIFSGIIRDISERKLMEEELRDNQTKLEENNQLLQ